jgi:uncharacterized protein YjhX (UPF0386 family)
MKLSKTQQKMLDVLIANPTAKIYKTSGSMFSKQSIKINVENPDTGGLYTMTLSTFNKLAENKLIKRESEESDFCWILNDEELKTK